MAIQKTDAILLKKKDLRETSLILTFFTKDFGKIKGVMKGVRGSRARGNVKSLFFSLDQIVYYEKEKKDLFTISQCEPQEVFLNILRYWDRARYGYYILEIMDVFTEQGGGDSSEIFKHLLNSLVYIDKGKEAKAIARIFEIKFLMSLGLWPGADNCNLSKGARATLTCFENESWQNCSKIKLTKDVGEEIGKITETAINDNLDRPLKTIKIFKDQ